MVANDSTTRTVHVTARVPVELAQAFERVAMEQDRSISAELRRVMRQHVETCSRDRLHGAHLAGA